MHCSSRHFKRSCPLLKLPVSKFTQLNSLQLYEIKAQLPAQFEGLIDASNASSSEGATLSGSSSSSSSSGALAAALPQLQKVGLHSCELTVQLAPWLLSTTTLTSLQWEGVQLYKDDWTEQLEPLNGLAILWQQLQLLPSPSALRLNFSRVGGMTAADIAPLSKLQRLQRLTLQSPFSSSFPEHVQSHTRALLVALQPLTQLQHLELRECRLGKAAADPWQRRQGDSNQCFSAVTASTQLTALILETDLESVVVPQAAFSHMFPAGRMLEDLQRLRLDCTNSGWQHCVEAPEIAMIAASCPALERLKLWCVTPKDFDTICLLQLPSGVTQVEGLGWVRPTP
jgi:hypothetical protein